MESGGFEPPWSSTAGFLLFLLLMFNLNIFWPVPLPLGESLLKKWSKGQDLNLQQAPPQGKWIAVNA